MDDIVRLTRSKLDTGLLTAQRPEKTLLIRGEGARCAGCDEGIEPIEPQYAFFSNGVVTHRFHVACHAVWEAECRQRGWRSS